MINEQQMPFFFKQSHVNISLDFIIYHHLLMSQTNAKNDKNDKTQG